MDTDFLLTKQKIDDKLIALLIDYQQGSESFYKQFKDNLPVELRYKSSKVNKGQNYNGLPYWVVDLPSYFNKEDFFTFRLVIWWGNFISISLIASGKFQKAINIDFSALVDQEVYYCINKSPWLLEHTSENLILIENKHLNTIHMHDLNAGFLKLSKRFELKELYKLNSISTSTFELIIPTLNWRNI